MTSKTFFSAVSLTLTAATFVEAHGPVVQIGVEGGKIVTRGLVNDTADYGDVNPLQSSYVVPMTRRAVGDANDGWYAQPNTTNPEAVYLGPGIKYGNSGFTGGVTITETIVDGLKLWKGSAFVDPGEEQLQGLRGSIGVPTATLTTIDGGPGGAFSVTTAATVSTTAHTQLYWRLLGDGVAANSASDDGVYLLTLQLSTSQAGVARSDPFYLLFDKNASTADAAAARTYVDTTLVPEPASITIVGMAATGLLTRRPRNRRRMFS